MTSAAAVSAIRVDLNDVLDPGHSLHWYGLEKKGPGILTAPEVDGHVLPEGEAALVLGGTPPQVFPTAADDIWLEELAVFEPLDAQERGPVAHIATLVTRQAWITRIKLGRY